MQNETEEIKLKEKYPSLFEAYSSDIVLFVLSEKTSQKIANICIEHKITDQEKVGGIAFRIAYALFGKLPKENLALTIENGLEIEKEKAESIAKRADEILFSELEKVTSQESSLEEKSEEAKETPQIPQKPSQEDTYREPVD